MIYADIGGIREGVQVSRQATSAIRQNRMWGLSGVILGGISGGVGGDLDDKVGIEGHADPFQ
jgi:hypothetical protein